MIRCGQAAKVATAGTAGRCGYPVIGFVMHVRTAINRNAGEHRKLKIWMGSHLAEGDFVDLSRQPYRPAGDDDARVGACLCHEPRGKVQRPDNGRPAHIERQSCSLDNDRQSSATEIRGVASLLLGACAAIACALSLADFETVGSSRSGPNNPVLTHTLLARRPTISRAARTLR